MSGTELPDDIKELIKNCDANCTVVESTAIETVASFEVPVFNMLRDITSQNCYLALRCTSKWFGISPTLEHCACLVVLTDYISVSYNNTNFYGTFIEAKQDKFYEGFFLKLSNEWKKVFYKLSHKDISLEQFKCLENNLKRAFKRFRSDFMYKWILHDIITECKDFGARLKKFLSQPLPEVSAVHTKPETKIDSSFEGFSDKPKTSDSLFKKTDQSFLKPKNSLFVSSKDDLPTIKSNSSNEPQVIVIDDSPKKNKLSTTVTPVPPKIRCKSFASEEMRPNFLLSKASVMTEFCRQTSLFKSKSNENSGVRDSKINTEKRKSELKPMLPNKINAFDVLMKRVVIKKNIS